ncbi:MAG TPA: CotH kinase family protein [Mobilitalea sp.]|nr:CotH kinase family protein [Mobilitalea sp.]
MKKNSLKNLIAIPVITIIFMSGCDRKAEQSATPSQSAKSQSSVSGDGNLYFSQSGGLYEQEFSLQLSTDVNSGIIRYTIDGSDPTSDSLQYSKEITITDRTSEPNLLSEMITSSNINNRSRPGENNTSSSPIGNVFKGTVVKAAVFSENGERLSKIYVQSYFVSKDILTRYNLPIVSIVTDADNFFDSTTGIYTNYNQSGSAWERPVHFELFEADGTAAVSLNMGVRINGGTTRSLAQKALKFYANSSYDEDNPSIEYELFDGLTTSYSDDLLTSFQHIILRSSGNDNSGGSLFRDALMQSLVSDLNVDTQAYRPCVAFVNGEFWGIYNIRERYDAQYFASHYNIDKDKVALLELSKDCNGTPVVNEGDESDLAYYNEMWNFFNDNSLADSENYQKALEYIDIDNFIDYYITNIYSGNQDWPGNNNLYWRYKTDNGGYDSTAVWYKDGRFRWIIKDMDWGFGLMVEQSSDTLSFAMGDSASDNQGGFGRGRNNGFNSSWSTLMFRKLLENDQFKAKFINRFCDVMNTNYEVNTVVDKINEMKTAIEKAIPEQSARFPSSVSSVSSWEASVNKMIQFAQERTGYIQSFLASKFSLSSVVTVTLKADSSSGYIRINDTNINTGTRGVTDTSSWSGSYFAGTTQTLTAVPLEGHKFVKFVVTDTASGKITEYSASTIEVTLGSEGTIVHAIFQ